MKQATHLGPDFRIAQPKDIAVIHHPDTRRIPENYTSGERQLAERFRACREALGSQATLREATYPGDRENGEASPIKSWDDLATHTTAWVGEFIDSRDLSGYAALQGESVERTAWHVKDAARAAIVISTAFMEVVAKVKAPRELTDPDQEIADTVLGSQGVVLEMASLDAGVTRGLAAAVADPSTPRNVDNVFNNGLRFDKQWFAEQEDGKVIVDPARVDQLRHKKNKSRNPHYPKTVEKHPTEEDKGGKLFACPERHMAPYILKRMASDAAEAGLFSQTYQAERELSVGQPEPALA